MIDRCLAPAAPGTRPWRVYGLFGAALALTAITVAHASLPPVPKDIAQRRPTAELRAETPPPAPQPLVAFGEPVPGYPVISPWGLRRLPWEKHGRLHEGVDIAAPKDEPIVAVADGVVLHTGDSATYGRFVEVAHPGGLTSFYAHLGGIAPGLRPGLAVKRGVQVAKVGNGGTSTGPHLHFEIRKGEQPLNPVVFMNHSFATAQALPVRFAEKVGPQVRIAYVSTIPESKRELMDDKADDGQTPRAKGRVNGRILLAKAKEGRVRGTFYKVYDSDAGLPALPVNITPAIKPAAPPVQLDEG